VRDILPHPNADVLELAVIEGYQTVVRKGVFTPGDLVAYIPEAAVLPDPVLETLGMKDSGLLSGRLKNRVKAIRLRGALSQGICYPVQPTWVEGQEVQELLGIVKYIPPVPSCLEGQVEVLGVEHALHFDVDNYQMFPDVLQTGEEVVFTEKIHGTFSVFGLINMFNSDALNAGYWRPICASKRIFAQGLTYKDCHENDENIYMRAFRYLKVPEKIRLVIQDEDGFYGSVYIMGETYGVQDLKYGANQYRDETLGFRVFDIFVGAPSEGRYLNDQELERICQRMGLPRVPVLYRGPYSKEVQDLYTEGLETVSGKALHMREGIVMAPVVERRDDKLGRVKLKSVSAQYLLRKGKDATEFD